jgi:hypothetical protein
MVHSIKCTESDKSERWTWGLTNAIALSDDKAIEAPIFSGRLERIKELHRAPQEREKSLREERS